MECRKLTITLISAENLSDVRHLGRMKVYAKTSLKGSSKTTQKTPVDSEGETNPRWNFAVDYTISESTVQKPGVDLVIELFCKRTRGDKLLGEVNLPVKSLFDVGIKSEKILRYNVGGTRDGILNILYSFSEKIKVNPRSSRWRKAAGVGFFLLFGGAMVLLSGKSDHDEEDDDDDDDDPVVDASKDVRVDQTDDEAEVFYDFPC